MLKKRKASGEAGPEDGLEGDPRKREVDQKAKRRRTQN